jgi:putative ABC transport system permease protein
MAWTLYSQRTFNCADAHARVAGPVTRLDHARCVGARLEEELRFHRNHLQRAAEAAGATTAAARSIATRRLGNLTRVHEDARERWSIPWLDQTQQDVRFALRALRRSPGFTATVIITLGLGIGANTVMFNIVDRLMFRPHAYLRDPGTAHRIYWQRQEQGATVTTMTTQYARYLDLQKWTTSFSQFAAFSERDLAIGTGESSRERRVGVVSASFFDFFDARPVLGRFFVTSEDATPRGADVAVLSHGFWQSEFGGRDVLGQLIQVADVRATIIGVAPPGFAGVNDAYPPVLYVPITTYAGSTGTNDARTYFSRYDWGWVNVLVRRKPGISLEQAEADASQAFHRSWEAARNDDPENLPAERARPHAVVSSIRPGAGPTPSLDARTAVWVSMVAAIVLLIACANVANLFLARALRRRRETAVRLALGVSRRRLLSMWLTESLVLALLGGVTALLVARWAGEALRAWDLDGLRRLLITTESRASILMDWRTVSVTAGMAIATGLLVGLLPSFWFGRGDQAQALRGGARGGESEGARVRGALVIVQATLSVALLVGAALFVKSLQAVQAVPMGYDVERVLMVRRVIGGSVFNDSAQLAMRRQLLLTARSIPGVESAAWASTAPFVSTSSTSLFVPGIDSVARLGAFSFQATTPDYFRTMGTRILRGRGLTADDRAGAEHVAVVSQSMANVLWPQQDAIGKCFHMRSDTLPCMRVVGIAEDMVQRELTGARYHYYVSIDQYTRTWGNWMLLRLRGDPAVEAESIRKALQRVMPGTSYVSVQPLRDAVQIAQQSWRMGAMMFLAFGLLALVVAAVGLYGVIAYGVMQRMHEWGVRAALGAQRSDILRLVLGQSVRFVAVGTGFGLLLAFFASRWIQPLLFQQSAKDPTIYGGVGALLFAVALIGGVLPALRAARVDPHTALKSE